MLNKVYINILKIILKITLNKKYDLIKNKPGRKIIVTYYDKYCFNNFYA